MFGLGEVASSALGVAGIGAGASLLGGFLGNAASAREAEKNRNFQASQAATQHQREVADLKAAGLNPILSGTGGPGNSAMSGSMAQQHDIVTPAVQTGMQSYKQIAEVGLLEASARKAAAEERNIEADTANKPKQGQLYDQQRILAFEQSLSQIAGRELTQNQARSVSQDIQESITREYTNKKSREEIEARVRLIGAEAAQRELLNRVLKEELPGMLDAAGLSSGAAGDAQRRSDMAADIAKKWADVFKGFIPGTSGPPSAPKGAYRLEPGPPQGGWPSSNQSAPSSARQQYYNHSQNPKGTSNYLGR